MSSRCAHMPAKSRSPMDRRWRASRAEERVLEDPRRPGGLPHHHSAAFKSSENLRTAATCSSVAGCSKPLPARNALIVRVETDAGITGIGEVDSNPMAAKGAIEGPFSHTTACGLAQVVIGEDPFETERLWHKMYRANIYGGRRGV